MFSHYFVFNSESYFGVFEFLSAGDCPEEICTNFDKVKVVHKSDLEKYLIQNVGKNILINKGFHPIYSIGKLYSKKPN